MKQKQIYQAICSIFLVLISMSLTISTLHSHNHIEWHHPQSHVDTGHCLTVDNTVCPMCAYLLKADVTSEVKVSGYFNDFELVDFQPEELTASPFQDLYRGRSPPFSV